jgi:hypothetical protein
MTTPTVTERTEDRARAWSILAHQQGRLEDLAAMLREKGDWTAAAAVRDAADALKAARERLE